MNPSEHEHKIESADDDKGYATGQSSPNPTYPLPDVITLQASEAGISSTLHVNLEPYISSYKAGDDDEHSSHRKMLENTCSGIGGIELWTTMLNAALNKAVDIGEISPSERLDIQISPVCEFMIDSFVEIVKNLLDEAILGHYEHGKDPQLELTIHIDNSDPDCIMLIIKDNGRGFPAEFLEKNSTLEGKKAYILEAGSTKKPTKVKTTMEAGAHKDLSRQTTPPMLFGGAGLGLRILMAKILRGDMLIGPGHLKSKYEKPLISEISLSNREDSAGSMIQIKTSRTPLQEKVDKDATKHPFGIFAPPIELLLPPKKIKNAITACPAPISAGASISKEMKEEMTKLRRIFEEKTELKDNESSEVRP